MDLGFGLDMDMDLWEQGLLPKALRLQKAGGLLPNPKRCMSVKALSLFVTEHYPYARTR